MERKVNLVDLKTLAKETSLSIFTLRKYIKTREMPHYQIGNKYLVDTDEFDSWFQQFKTANNEGNEKLSLHNLVDKTLENIGI
jgi:excisionase family DNA binding protein